MNDFTPTERTTIADSYTNMARALHLYQAQHWTELAFEQQLDLNAYQNSLLHRANDLTQLVTRPAFSDTASMTKDILDTTAEARDSLTWITDLTVAMNIGAMTVALAASVARASLSGIQIALRELSELVHYHN